MEGYKSPLGGDSGIRRQDRLGWGTWPPVSLAARNHCCSMLTAPSLSLERDNKTHSGRASSSHEPPSQNWGRGQLGGTCLSLTQNLLLILFTPAFYYLTSINVANEEQQTSLKVCLGRLPWWLSGKESAYQCRRHGFNPWSRKIPYATEQLSLWAPTTEPAL